VLGVVVLTTTPSVTSAQSPEAAPLSPASVVVLPSWYMPTWPPLPPVGHTRYAERGDRSAVRTIAIHTAVGTGAGLLLGLLLSSASTGGDQAAVILTWAGLGAAAGAVSGVVTWLAGGGP
jgi:hypothetical protein